MDIVLNNQKIDFIKSDLPMLISGAEKTGTSFFSICLLANLLKNGEKVLLFSAFSAAKEEFRKQINSGDDAVIIDSGDEQVFIEKIKDIPNLSDRIILIKNIDNYSSGIFNAIKDLKLVIFSGDLDKCEFADDLIKKGFVTKIFFSQSEKYPQDELTDLPKYRGKIVSDKYRGLISLNAIK